ncbi:MAG: peptidylprolyl isomerase [Anaerolineae bacterium CG2_30_64_16]|nr:MAG: peptidylprolyl isomerase [Anaerolineae bacterium CG2_30_64_16]
MTLAQLKVADGLVVELDYTLTLDDGEVVDTSADELPLQYLHGQGQIIPGLEKALVGLAVGDVLTVTVPPAEAYGDIDPDDYDEAPLDAFPPDAALEPGMTVEVTDDSGEVYDAFVSEIGDDTVLLDFNHPLAGETLHFDVKVIGLRPATDEELAHGHVHDDGHAH